MLVFLMLTESHEYTVADSKPGIECDVKVVLGHAASWQNIQICVKRQTVIRSSCDSDMT